MPQRKRSRKRYSAKRRAEILAAADKEGLTATDVQKRFGVIPVTYYSWRKKAKGAGRSGPPAARGRRPPEGFGSRVRATVRAKLERQLPAIVEQEVERYLEGMFGPTRKRRRA